MFRFAKYAVVTLLVVGVGGFLFLGRAFPSYLRTSASAVTGSVKNSVPIEFELRRARDLIKAILPELQAQVRAIAEEEVAISALEAEIEDSDSRLEGEFATLLLPSRQNASPTSQLQSRRPRLDACSIDGATRKTFRSIQAGPDHAGQQASVAGSAQRITQRRARHVGIDASPQSRVGAKSRSARGPGSHCSGFEDQCRIASRRERFVGSRSLAGRY